MTPGQRILLARHAMATRFEAVLVGPDAVRLRAAGEEALAEITAVERSLSLYRPDSDLSRMNRGVGSVPVALFRLMERCAELHAATSGAFDVTVGGAMRVWGLSERNRTDPARSGPDDEAVEAARPDFGDVELDAASRTVRYRRPGTVVDFGGIGKGVGIDRAREVLAAFAFDGVLLHGGTSTATAWGRDRDGSAFRIAVSHPHPDHAGETVAELALDGRALSVSSRYGKGYRDGDRWVGHVIDPRTGRPTAADQLAAVVADDATTADALSTALLVLGPDAASRLPVFGTVSWLTGRERPDRSLALTAGGLTPSPFDC